MADALWAVGERLLDRTASKVSLFYGTGWSSFLELVHDDDVARLGRHVVSRLGLKGVLKIDLKRDPRDGSLYILEVNARFNLWHYLGAVNGINLPKMVYEYLVRVSGPRPPATTPDTAGPVSTSTTRPFRSSGPAASSASGPGSAPFSGPAKFIISSPGKTLCLSFDGGST